MSTDNERERLWKEALKEVLKENFETGIQKIHLETKKPSLKEVKEKLGKFPPDRLLLGMSDSKPVQFNLQDYTRGSVLITGENLKDSEYFLHSIARGINALYPDGSVEYSVITRKPANWENETGNGFMGVYGYYTRSAEDFVLSLASYAHGNKRNIPFHVLLVDNIEDSLEMDYEARQNLRWLTLRGPQRRVWPFATAVSNYTTLENIGSYLDIFKTRIFSNIRDEYMAKKLGAPKEVADLKDNDFFVKSEKGQRRFWVPN